MKPLWGTRTLADPQGSASKLGATLGFEMKPLRGKVEDVNGVSTALAAGQVVCKQGNHKRS